MAITGTVRWFDAEKGYGFISRKDLYKDVFVDYQGIQVGDAAILEPGQLVEFDVEPAMGGLEARNVHAL